MDGVPIPRGLVPPPDSLLSRPLFFWRRAGRDPRSKSWAAVLEEEWAVLHGRDLQDLRAPDALFLERCRFESQRKDRLAAACEALRQALAPTSGSAPGTWLVPAGDLKALGEALARARQACLALPAPPERTDRVPPGLDLAELERAYGTAWRALDEATGMAEGLFRRIRTWKQRTLWTLLHGPVPWFQGFQEGVRALTVTFRGEDTWIERLTGLIEGQNHGALCLSGGGIRSAAFSLGVIQALAKQDLLQQFHYLSTVSGGGFTGGWLTAWLQRRAAAGDPFVELKATTRPWTAPSLDADGVDRFGHGPEPTPSPKPVWWVRVFSRYLGPRSGFLSGDALTLVSAILRNLVLNWMVLIPLVACILLLPRLLASLLKNASGTWAPGLVFAALLALMAGSAFAIDAFPVAGEAYQDWGQSRRRAFRSILSFSLGCGLMTCAAALAPGSWGHLGWTAALAAGIGIPFSFAISPQFKFSFGKDFWRNLLLFAVAAAAFAALLKFRFEFRGAVLMLASAYLAFLATILLAPILSMAAQGRTQLFIFNLVAPPVLVLGVILAWKAFLGGDPRGQVDRILCFGPPLFALAIFFSQVAGAGVLSRSRKMSATGREWFAALGGKFLLVALLWVASFGVALYGTWLVTKLPGTAKVFTGLTGLSLPVAAWAMLSSHRGDAPGDGFSLKDFLAGHVAVLGGVLGCLALVLGMNLLLDLGLARWKAEPPRTEAAQGPRDGLLFSGTGPQFTFALRLKAADGAENPRWVRQLDRARQEASKASLGDLAGLALGLLAIGLLAGWAVPLNHFTLHEIYRNRLVRTFLGASNPDRRPEPFSGMDDRDDLSLEGLQSDVRQRGCLLPVFNATLNTVYGEKLGWQDRKGRPFTFTPWHCGSPYLGFRDTEAYGGGIKLSTAMTVSGAALNPAMGYHTSPFLSALMTFFSIRLGLWLGNPGRPGDARVLQLARHRRAVHDLPSPRFAPSLILAEALGLIRPTYPYVNLSDGGHFDNLGLHAMLGRRCRKLVVVDCSEDPRYEYGDLGRLVRLARLDHGVDIAFPHGLPAPAGPGRYAVHGTLTYPDGVQGDLIYLKPVILGKEPRDVLSYRATAPAFPHQSTVDQFFGEAQFEAYRALGFHALTTALNDCKNPTDLSAWFGAIKMAEA